MVFFLSLIILLRLWWPIELKFSQICYCTHMLGYNKWEDWSLTITKGVHSAFNDSIEYWILAVNTRNSSLFVCSWESSQVWYLRRQWQHCCICTSAWPECCYPPAECTRLESEWVKKLLYEAVFRFAATAMTLSKCVAKDVLYFNHRVI